MVNKTELSWFCVQKTKTTERKKERKRESEVAQSCPTLCDPRDCSMPSFPVLHYLPGFPQTHVHWVSDAIQLSHPLSSLLLLPSIFPSIRVFSNESALQIRWSGGQSIGVSASTSVLPMNTQDWSPLEWTGWISLQSRGLSRVFSNTTVQKHQFFGAQTEKDKYCMISHCGIWKALVRKRE